MKKILFIFHDTNMTGSSITLFRIIENMIPLNKYDIHIAFAAEHGPIIDLFKTYPVTLHPLKKHASGGIGKKLFARFIHFLKFPFFIYSLKPALIYSNTLMNIGEVIIAKSMGIKTLVHSHEGKEIIRKYAPLIKIENHFVDEYIVVSHYAQKSLEVSTNSHTKKHVIYNGIELLPYEPNPKKEKIINLSVIATIDRNKAQHIAIQAFEALQTNVSDSLQLHFFGKLADLDYFNELNRYIEDKQLSSRIFFHGETKEQVLMYKSTDILLIPSLDETFSLTALEALNFSIPVIASDVGGLCEVIENDISGLLFEVGDSQKLTERILLLFQNHALRQKLIENGHKRVEQYFTIQAASQRISSVIDNLLQYRK